MSAAGTNDAAFGLAACVEVRDIGRICWRSDVLDYGLIGINHGIPLTAEAPFGGIGT